MLYVNNLRLSHDNARRYRLALAYCLERFYDSICMSMRARGGFDMGDVLRGDIAH